MVHGLEAEYWEQIDFVYLDHQDPINRELMREYGFRWRPYFVLVEADGTPVQTWFGAVPEDEFRAAFDELLDSS